MNILPAVIWALGFLAVIEWVEHLRILDGRGKFSDELNRSSLILWVGGTVLFGLIGSSL